MESLSASLEDKLNRLLNPSLQGLSQSSASGNSAKIQKVPPYLRERPGYEKYYSPKVVSIGPIHHPKGEELETIWASHYLKDKLGLKEEYAQRRPLEKILSHIQELKSLYSEDVIQGFRGSGDEELALILFVDGCAALHVMHEAVREQPKVQALYIMVEQDLLLLENQLPYQVLRILSKKEGDGHDDGDYELQSLVFRFLNRFNSQTRSEAASRQINHQHSAHLLDVLITSMLNKRRHERVIYVLPSKTKSSTERKRIHELKEAGIKIKKSNDQNLTGISLSDRTLYIPPFKVDDFTVQNFLNMIAYEMCPNNSNSNYEISNYISFLSYLVDIPEDVKELEKAGVLTRNLEREEVAKIFNTEITHLVFDTGIYDSVREKLEDLCSQKLRTWLSDLLNVKNWFTELQHNHFNTPWKIIGLISFILGFTLSVINIRNELRSKHDSSD